MTDVISVILTKTVIEENSNRVVVSNMASTLKEFLIDGKCHTETSLEKFIYRRISPLSKNAQDGDFSWSWFKTCYLVS